MLVRGEKGTAKSTTVRALAAVLPPDRRLRRRPLLHRPPRPAASLPDGPFASDARHRAAAGAPGRAAGRRHRGPRRSARSTSSARCRRGGWSSSRGCWPAPTAGSSTSTRSTCCTTTWSTCCSTPPPWGARRVERDGVSIEHPARFVLIGTMNPEEGELRPQLLDRFGLTVEVAAPRDPALRAEVVRRRMAFDADADAFVARLRPTTRPR